MLFSVRKIISVFIQQIELQASLTALKKNTINGVISTLNYTFLLPR